MDRWGSGGFKIRVITPALAKNPNSILPLANGRILNDHVTLREIRALIMESLNLSVNSSTYPQGDQECNCTFAKRIHERGRWEKIECHGHSKWSADCCYRSGSKQISMSTLCAICNKQLSDHTDKTAEVENQPANCGRIFMRTDTSCNHVLHSLCLETANQWTCPESCLSCKYDPRIIICVCSHN